MRQLVEAGVTEVVILPDHDEVGRAHAEDVARCCAAAGLPVKVVELPGLNEGGDISDWLTNGGTPDELEALVQETAAWQPGDGDEISW